MRAKRTGYFLGAAAIIAVGSYAQIQVGLRMGEVIEEPIVIMRLLGWLLFYILYDWGSSLFLQIQVEKYFDNYRIRLLRQLLNHHQHQPNGNPWLVISHTIFHLNDEITHKWLWIGRKCMTAIAAMIGCCTISVRLTIYLLLLLFINTLLLQRISRKSQLLQKRVLRQKGVMSEWVQQSSDAIETIQAYQMEPIMMDQMEKQDQEVYQLSCKSDRQRILLMVIKYFVSIESLLLILLAGRGESVSTLISFSALSVYIQGGIEMLDHIFYSYRLCKADIETIHEIEVIS